MAALTSLMLSACSVLSPVPAWELVKGAGMATSTALASAAPARASNTVHHGDAPVRAVCIEFNRNAPLEDLVPAMQAELKEQGVDSRVYEPGTGLQQCGVWLRYVATIEWGVPPMSGGYRANLSAASLSLHRADGTLLSSSSYLADENFGMARWAGTRNKIAPVVKALVTGFTS
ncbi:cell division protein FtsI [Roseateles sp. MS654]|uniref:cell division protein FtsI n=1 Tax=Roseateles sp. MS654 TaxID=3412685 RepID=UPI003C2F9148